MRRSMFALICGGLLLGATMAVRVLPQFKSWPIREAPAEWRAVLSRADLIVVSMHDSLLWQLHHKLAEGGPALAFGVCHIDTTELTHRLGRYDGIAAGFTSDRLRNPTNRPKEWAAGLVAAHAGRRARDVDGFAVDLGDRIGVLRPMVATQTCATCHGPVERMTPEVRRRIAERYPSDRAVGFAEGEIRGWFWVEMPKPPR
ncbi:MAG TPA: DUF3365 domain-containing protein [Vicinamibacterales bacterium]|nr:DUF3365 domain-containing protein [Vicinamibacterales bacterium]